jgi:hypothetical protein
MKTKFTGNSKLRSLLYLTGLLCFFVAAPKARADQGDPPSRAARMSFVEGTVSFQPGGEGEWGTAAKNRPVTVGDKVWADKDSRAELQAGQASIHMGSMTALSFLNLDENMMQVRIAEGAINFRVREMREGDLYEVDTPNLAFTVKEAGAFRVEVNESGDATRVTAIRGEGEITAGNKTYAVHAGERAELTGADDPQYQVSSAPPPDGLDRWAAERDLREDNSTSARYVSRDVPGYSDLDDNGVWNEEPDYGPVWYPNTVAVDWAPYSSGYWNWVGPWGWTWIGYEPWGYAPFHYGRWGLIGGRWGWCPGPIYARPFFGPAFVGFLGGSHWGVGFGFDGGFGVGWFPLGFREPFFPGFRCSRTFITNINIRNTTIRNVNVLNSGGRNFNYAFAHNVNAVTATSRSGFVGGQMVNRGSMHVTQASLRGAEVSNRASFAPSRQSAFGAANSRGGRIATPSAAVQNRSVMARTAPGGAAAHTPVRTFNNTRLAVGRAAGSPVNNSVANRTTMQGRATVNNDVTNRSTMQGRTTFNNNVAAARQNQLSQNRPPSNSGAFNNRGVTNGSVTNNARGATRNWEAQGNTTDRGRAPQGFGSSNHPTGNLANGGVQNNNTTRSTGFSRSDRPPWAGSGANGGGSVNSRSNGGTFNSNRPAYNNNSRSYEPPSRSYSPPNNSQTYSAPRSYYPAPRSYSAPSYSAPSHNYSAPSYSAPSHNYSAPSHNYSAPSHSYSGGGGGSRGGGGGSPHSGGGVSHGSSHH